MVYSSKFVAVVVNKGQIVRELREDSDDVIRLPFGSDYSIRLKNLHSERAVVNIEIDGQDVLDGSQIVVSPNETADVEGFMEGSTVHKKFRFIEKTQQISEHRGDFVEDGIIRISYQFEKPKPPIKLPYYPYDYYWRRRPYWDSRLNKRYGRRHSDNINIYDDGHSVDIDAVVDNSTFGATADCGTQGIMRKCSLNDKISPEPTIKSAVNDDGITVAGANTYQSFNTTHVGLLETQSHSIVIRILGQTKKGKKFQRPKITRRKIQCPTCGTRSQSSIKFCSNCGTNISDIV